MKRHNLAAETELAKHNRQAESQNLLAINETIRSNKARESLQRGTLHETNRHNLVMEGLQADLNASNIQFNSLKAAGQELSNQNMQLSINKRQDLLPFEYFDTLYGYTAEHINDVIGQGIDKGVKLAGLIGG